MRKSLQSMGSDANANNIKFINYSVPILVLVMAFYPLIPLIYAFSSSFLPILYNTTRWSIFMVLGLFAWFIVLFSRFKNIGKFHLQLSSTLLFLFLSMMATSAYFSSHQSVVWLGDSAYMTGLISHIGFAALFLLAMQVSIRNSNDMEIIINAWLTSAALIALIGLLQYFGVNILPFGDRETFEPTASYSTLFNPNDLGSYMVMAFPFATHRFLRSISTNTVVIVALIYGVTLTSLTRGAWIGLLVGFIFLLFLYPRKNYLVHFIILLFIVTVAIMPLHDWKLYHRMNTFSQETEKALAGDPETGASRFLLWQEGVKALPQSLLIGTGPDTFFYVSPEAFEEGFRNPKIARKAHNIYLEYAITIGIPGLLFFLWFIKSITMKSNIKKEMHVVFLAMVIIHLVRGFFLVDVIQVYPLFWVLMGFYAGITMKKNQGLELA